MSSSSVFTRRIATGFGLAVTTGVVLRRMERDFRKSTKLRPATSALVYTSYGAHGLAMLNAAFKPSFRLGVPWRLGVPVGLAASMTGIGLFLGGARAFATPDQLSGTETGDLVTAGIYRWTRNPQYLGYLLICGGTASATRSAEAAALTVLAASAFAWWIRCEEHNLERVFGNDYARYVSSTHRWLGPATG